MRRCRVRGLEGDTVELMFGPACSIVATTDASLKSNKRSVVMVSDRGLRKIAERIALHLGFRLEPYV